MKNFSILFLDFVLVGVKGNQRVVEFSLKGFPLNQPEESSPEKNGPGNLGQVLTGGLGLFPPKVMNPN